jgi:hypothetical protein
MPVVVKPVAVPGTMVTWPPETAPDSEVYGWPMTRSS